MIWQFFWKSLCFFFFSDISVQKNATLKRLQGSICVINTVCVSDYFRPSLAFTCAVTSVESVVLI